MAKVQVNDRVVIESRGIKSILPNNQGDTVITYLKGAVTIIPAHVASQQEIMSKLQGHPFNRRFRR